MKEETKNLIVWIKKQINLAKETCINPCHKDGYPEYEANYEKAMNFLDSLPEIEHKLCQGGYIQDKNGIPCCHGDKIKFKFSEKYFDECWKDRYARIEYGELKFDVNDKRFVILFGEDKNGFDWIDWNGVFEGCEWFEKVSEKVVEK